MRIELSELGEGQFIEIRDVKKMSWKQQKEITSAFKDDSLGAQLDVAELVTINLIKGGYLLDVDDKPVAFPLTVDTVGDIPALVVEKVASAFAESRGQAAPKN